LSTGGPDDVAAYSQRVDVTLRAVGAAAPSLRVEAHDIASAWGARGRGSVAVCAADEDPLTLAWSAATDALAADGGDAPTGLWWGTTRPPFAEGPSWSYLAAALGVGPEGALFSGSPHAGVEALLAAWDAVAAGTVHTALVVASDALVPDLGSSFERRAGAGAVAVVIGTGHGPARLTTRTTRSRPALDRYRGDLESATRDTYDPRAIRQLVFLPEVLAAAADVAAPADATWSLPDPDGRLAATVAEHVGGTDGSAEVRAALGETGAAAALLGAIPGLRRPGTVVAVAHGGGRTTAVTIVVDGHVPGADDAIAALASGRSASYAEALRSRGQLVAGGESVAMGIPPGSAMFARATAELLAFEGARCVDCGVINTPPSVHPACTGCGGAKLEVIRLARGGEVHTFVVNETMPAPFVAPLPIVVVDLDDSARVMTQAVGDGSGVDIGTRVRMVLRRYAIERGAPVYGMKALPLVAGG